MIERYTLPRMKAIWEPGNKFRKWLQIEILACEALAELGEIPKDAVDKIKKRARFDVKRIAEVEEVVKHDVIAFLTVISEGLDKESRYLHMGLTSSDILDTSMALLMQEAASIIIEDIEKFLEALKEKAFAYKDTVMIGRTHGVHAEPITFGLKMALWYEEMGRNLKRMKASKEGISYGKISGAVGTFANISPYVEEYVCKQCGLRPAPVSSQIIQRDRYAEYLSTLSIIASSIDKFAVELRHLQRTEVLEVEEYFSEGQKGSSAMPHKRNPIGSENLSGLARIIRANSIAAMENIPLWHERDISHSSVERVIIPDGTILIDFMLNRITDIVKNLIVYPENMRNNLNKTGGLIFSERILLQLIKKGLLREEAYRLVQRRAMAAWRGEGEFKKLIIEDPDIKEFLSTQEIEDCFDLTHHLRNVDYIFKRVFK